MVNYDPKAWIRVTVSVDGTVLPRVLGRMLFLAFVALALCVVHVWWPLPSPPNAPLAHSIMGVTVGLLIVFRNNCSYDRYWEGRRLWGTIVNSSRNLLRTAAAYAGGAGELANLMAAYSLALKQHLRGNTDLDEIKPLVSEEVFAQAAAAANPPSIIAFYMSKWIHDQRGADRLDPMQERTLESMVGTIIDCQGGCERILRTPIPFAYAVHIKQLLFLFLVTLPLVLVPFIHWAAPVAMLVIAFGLLGIEEAGVEIEDPFGDDPNDLPIESICAVIGRDTMALANLPEQSKSQV